MTTEEILALAEQQDDQAMMEQRHGNPNCAELASNTAFALRALQERVAELEKKWALRAVCECGYIGVGLTHCAACDTFIPMRLENL